MIPPALFGSCPVSPRRLTAAALAMLLLLPLAAARADLTVTEKSEGMGRNFDVVRKYKGDKVRVDIAGNLSTILDLKSGEVLTLDHGHKAATRVPVQAMQAKQQNAKASPAGAPSLSPTGHKDRITGYDAEEYTTTMGGYKVTLWLTKAMPNYKSLLEEMTRVTRAPAFASLSGALGVNLGDLPGFPLRTSSEVAPGQTVTSTVVSVSTNALSDGDFTVPSDYQQSP